MMANVNVVDRWAEGNPSTVSADADKVRILREGERTRFSLPCFFDDYLQNRVQHSGDGATALTGLGSLRPRALVRARRGLSYANPSVQTDY